jgi:hypothetical protein
VKALKRKTIQDNAAGESRRRVPSLLGRLSKTMPLKVELLRKPDCEFGNVLTSLSQRRRLGQWTREPRNVLLRYKQQERDTIPASVCHPTPAASEPQVFLGSYVVVAVLIISRVTGSRRTPVCES